MLKKVGGDIIASLDRKLAKHQKLADELSKEFTDLYFTRLKENIQKNKFGFKLAESTLKKRRETGSLSVVPLIDKGDYIAAIIKEGFTVTMLSGKHPNGITYEELWYVLEYGRKDKSVPAFPVWRRTFEELKPEFKAMVSKKLKSIKK